MQIRWQLTDDVEEKQVYYDLRKHIYRESINLTLSGKPDRYDAYSRVLIATDGDQIVGGARMTFSFAGELPHEEYTTHFLGLRPEFASQGDYCEMSRLAVLPSYRGPKVMKQFFRTVDAERKRHNLSYVMSLSEHRLALLYAHVAKGLGYQAEIVQDVRLKTNVLSAMGEMCIVLIYSRKPDLHTFARFPVFSGVDWG